MLTNMAVVFVANIADISVIMQYMSTFDRYNSNILRELQTNGRISNIELADRVGLSPSACLRRVQDLEKSGVISGYRAVINPEAVGIGFSAYLAIGLVDHTMPSQQVFEQAMQNAQAVRECHNVTGTVEYLIRVEVTDLAAYKTFHADVLGALPQVNSITTYVIMDSPKNERG